MTADFRRRVAEPDHDDAGCLPRLRGHWALPASSMRHGHGHVGVGQALPVRTDLLNPTLGVIGRRPVRPAVWPGVLALLGICELAGHG